MGKLLGPDGREVDSQGNAVAAPGLDMSNPVGSLDLLGAVARANYIMAKQYASLAGVKGERHVKILAKDISGVASQGASVAEFASNCISELAFSLAEAEARIAVIMGAMPEDKVQAAKELDMKVAVEWENRRSLFSGNVPILLRTKKRLGPALAEAIAGSAPTAEDFAKQVEAAKAAGLDVGGADAEAQKAEAEAKDRYEAALKDGLGEAEAREIGWPSVKEHPVEAAKDPAAEPAAQQIQTLEDAEMHGGPPKEVVGSPAP